jgi:hypothetical protein
MIMKPENIHGSGPRQMGAPSPIPAYHDDEQKQQTCRWRKPKISDQTRDGVKHLPIFYRVTDLALAWR